MPKKKSKVEKAKKTKVGKKTTESVTKQVLSEEKVVEKKLASVADTPVEDTPVLETPVVETSEEKVVEEKLASQEDTSEDTDETQVNNDLDISSTITSMFDALIANGEEMLLTQRSLVQLTKKTNKAYTRDRRDFTKNLARSRRQQKKDPNRKKREPSGFAVATDISDKLCDFLGVSRGTQLSRTEVTRKVTTYIREKNLQIAENRRSFVPDNGLQDILGPLQEVDKEKGFTYFNLQRYITPHITSSASTPSVSASSC